VKIFLDTSGLLSVFDRSDTHHAVCSTFWREQLPGGGNELIISDYVLDELTTRVLGAVSHNSALQALGTLLELVERKQLRLIWVDQTYFAQARSIFERYDDQEFSFTDCTSFAICRNYGIEYAFALDADFATFGLNRLPAA